MKAVILVVFVLTVAAVLCLLEAYREQQYFKVTEDGVVSRRLNGLKKEKKIVFLSDLHNKEYGVGSGTAPCNLYKIQKIPGHRAGCNSMY